MKKNTQEEIIQLNKNKILKNDNFSATFPHHDIRIFRTSNLHNAIGSFDIRNINFDNGGNLRLKIYDTYDFNKENKDFLNSAGREKMQDGELKPFFTIHDIFITKKELNKIWK